jgi:hypothetical protein
MCHDSRMSEMDLDEAQEHLERLWAMSLESAQALKQRLYERRRLIDGQLLAVEQVIARHRTDGRAPAFTMLPHSPEPLFPTSGPPSSGLPPSRRLAFLSIMAQDPNRDWHLKELKPLMVAAGVVEDDATGTNRVSAAAAETKKNQEVAHIGPSLYRITEKGMAAVAAG